MLTAARLRELLDYNPETGVFTRLKSFPGPRARAGSILRYYDGSGYLAVMLDAKVFLGHRLAWFYVHGEWPPHDVDHINGDKRDNRIVNLRLATRSQNAANCKLSRRNTSGYKGAYLDKTTGRWMAKIRVNYRLIHLGCFDTPEEAHVAYMAAAAFYFGQFARAA